MNTKDIIRNARERLGIESLTPMQQRVASLGPGAESVALIAPTGSGKTLAFALWLLRAVTPAAETQAMVISPSRELALQTSRTLSALAPALRVAALYGGHSMTDETRSLQGAVPQIAVGTPGRLLDHIGRGSLDVGRVSALVIDEYDKLLELGFQDEMGRLVRKLRRLGRVMLTSATPPGQLPAFLPAGKPLTLDFTSGEAMPQLRFFDVKSATADKLESLAGLLDALPRERTIVFANHRESAERIHGFLKKRGYPVALYHGGLQQQERETAVDLLVSSTAPILVATDLAARGLDVPQVRSVVHYHMPSSPETMTHRNGRAARMGADGDVYFLTGPDEYAPVDGALPMQPEEASAPWRSDRATIYFHAGRKEKLSKGDVVGALTGIGGLAGNEIGAIALHDHRALVAVPASKAEAAVRALNAGKVKGKRVRVSLLR